ncbi:hypothetical protein CYY_002733 [Polysphondylium violaceum]|uniref:Uncharacterized protein n=1 Tax=Polysphondylium violaceum TaxID=133409 RepID=A0A8J4V6M3_9MYCE|nr:hypothetical protein CYY_002733 [Polysphondylium violaceum]
MIDASDIVKLYSIYPQLDLIDKLFDKNCQFEGYNFPSFKLQGIKDIKEMFKAVPLYAKELKVIDYTTTNSSNLLMIDCQQNLVLRALPWFSFNFRMILNIHKKDNKITRFESILDMESLIQNIPFASYGYFNIVKPSLGYFITKLGSYNKHPTQHSNKIAVTLTRLSDNYTEKTNTSLFEEVVPTKVRSTVDNVWRNRAQPVSF